MNITIPVYIEQSQKKGAPPIFEIRPLFYDSPVGHNEKLSKAMSRTASKIRKTLNLCAQQARHDDLAKWTYCPPLKPTHLTLTLHLRRRVAKCHFLFVSFPHKTTNNIQ